VRPKTDGRRDIDPAGDRTGALAEILQAGKRIVRILSDALEPAIFDTEAVAPEISRIARSGRQCEVRILLKDSRNLSKRRHRLGTLHRRLESNVQIRKLTEFPEHFIANYVLVDDGGVFFMPMDDDKVCLVNAYDSPLVRYFTEQFDDLWSRSAQDPELRVMPL
jgi:hypothetical protein